MRSMSVSKKFTFDAAHRLHRLPRTHKCSNLHGHTYGVEVTIVSNVLNPVSGFIIDFNDMKPFKAWLNKYLDHATIIGRSDSGLLDCCRKMSTKHFVMPHYMGNVDYLDATSSEHLAALLTAVVRATIFGDINPEDHEKYLVSVAVSETGDNTAVYNELIPNEMRDLKIEL